MKNIELIENYLDELFPNPKCELNYSNEYELLINIMLSAQTTDKRVNIVTKSLFKVANTPEQFAKMNIKEIENLISSISL